MRLIDDLRYRCCECCTSNVVKQPLLKAAIRAVSKRPVYCATCTVALSHLKKCKEQPCMFCGIWKEYLDEQENKVIAARFIESCGITSLVLEMQ